MHPNADAPALMQGCSLEITDIEQAEHEGLQVEITCKQNSPQRRVAAWRPVLVPYAAPAEGSDAHPPTYMHDCLYVIQALLPYRWCPASQRRRCASCWGQGCCGCGLGRTG